MGCGCGKSKLPAERSAQQQAAREHQATLREARRESPKVWNAPKKKA
jgi:hypothetical protein